MPHMSNFNWLMILFVLFIFFMLLFMTFSKKMYMKNI